LYLPPFAQKPKQAEANGSTDRVNEYVQNSALSRGDKGLMHLICHCVNGDDHQRQTGRAP
jgi:hypothetical protein